MRPRRSDEINALIARAALVAVAVVGIVGLTLLLPRFVGDLGLAVVPGLAVAFVALLTVLLIPVHTLPAVALTVFALVPPRLLSQEGALGAMPLTTLIVVVWAARRALAAWSPGRARDRTPAGGTVASSPWSAATRLSAVFLLAWSIFSLFRSSETQTSTGWLISFTAGALLPLAVPAAAQEGRLVRRAWMVLGGSLGAYAVLEAMIGANPVWGTVYAVLGAGDSQHWSVYRAEASFGHPLFASLFFAVACALAVGAWLTTHERWTLAAALLSALGLASTVSRGALLAGAVAVAFCYLAALVARGEKRWNRFALFALLAVIGGAGVLQFDALAARNDSLEAERSAFARDLGLVVALQAARVTGFLGSGPGTSGITARLFDDVVIENSGLQLLISVGVPGLLLFVAAIGFAVAHALSVRAVGEAAALVAYAGCIAGFNAIDALRPMHLLLGLLLLIALNAPRRIASELMGPPAAVRNPGRAPATSAV